MPINSSRHSGGYQAAQQRSMTLAVFYRPPDGHGAPPVLVDSYTFRYAPKMMQVADMGLIRTEPTGSGMVVENGGYWATSISIQGHTGHAAKMMGGRLIDGESMLQSLREMIRDTFGARRVPGTSPKKTRINGQEYPYDSLEMHLYNWLGERSSELQNQEFYRVVPAGQNLFSYRRAVPQQSLWNFTLALMGERVSTSDASWYLQRVLDDPVNKALVFAEQFSSTWDYLLSLTLDETGTRAFSWVDRINASIAESYYRVAGTLYDIKNSLSLAVMRGQAHTNIPLYMYAAMNDFIDDVCDDLGVAPNSYAASPAKAHYDYQLLREVQESGREMKRLLPYPDQFGVQMERRSYRKHLCKPTETVKTIASTYGADWNEVVARNNMIYPYTVAAGQEIIVPLTPDRELTNTIRSWRGADNDNIEISLYGEDMAIDDQGEWITSDADQDIELISGVRCVVQAVESMEKTLMGEFFDYAWYGNPMLRYKGQMIHAGELNVMLVQLQEAIQAHPSVDRVGTISLDFKNGALLLDVTFNLINNTTDIKTQTLVAK